MAATVPGTPQSSAAQAELNPPPSNSSPPIKVDYERLKDFEFTPPPHCPIFEPTEQEFAMGPLEYINKIRPQAEAYGICKIIPPKSFSIPFAIDVKEFHFSPRSQRLNELEALTRIKLNFHDRVLRFWDLQGICLRFPTIDRKILDLYTFHHIVKEEGGFEICTRDRKWTRVTGKMNLSRSNASFLRSYYEKILYPYDIFLSGATTGPEIKPDVAISQPSQPTEVVKEEQSASNSKEEEKQENQMETSDPQHSELKKLQTYGAGPRMPGVLGDEKLPKGRYCQNCNGIASFNLLTCNNCQNSFHKYCMFPPFNDTPKHQWHCHSCVKEKLAKTPQLYTKDFGFLQSHKTYNLAQFGDMGTKFKSEYFSSPSQEVPLETVEKEFWRIASAFEGGITVEYGADLHTNDYGSGFPTGSSTEPAVKKAIDSQWNLNNLPTLNGSVFKHINTNINGMIIPWMYVGMCFSAFCWHNEDHWTYSINYLHWGEPKIWYGVPGGKAEAFEEAMLKIAPELFSSQPDLLHQLVTTCNPNVLAQHDIPITKAVQKAGEFIVTFPRSYHSGFNQGYNFAEAVNFATADWLPIGRLSIAHYASLHRYPVFSHDELVCKMADGPGELDMRLSHATYEDIQRMVNSEKILRMEVFDAGITASDESTFENLKDDERQCEHCKTTCFLSAVRCKCNNKLVCLYHRDHICSKCLPEECTALYRYTLDELRVFLINLETHITLYKQWQKDSDTVLKANRLEEKATIFKFKELLEIAQSRKYSNFIEPIPTLQAQVKEASSLEQKIKELIAIPYRGSSKLTVEEIDKFVHKVNELHCRISGAEKLNDIYEKVRTVVDLILNKSEDSSLDMKNVIQMADTFKFMNFDFQLEKFKVKYLETDWDEKYESTFEAAERVELKDLNELIDKGVCIASCSPHIVEKINSLKHLRDAGTRFKETVKRSLRLAPSEIADGEQDLPSLEFLNAILHWHNQIDQLQKINLEPDYSALTDLIDTAQAWKSKATAICHRATKNGPDEKPMLKTVEEMVDTGKKINCFLPEHQTLEAYVKSAKAWIEELTETMIDSLFKFYRPIDALVPRTVETSNNLTSRGFYLVLMRKGPFKESYIEQQLKSDYSSDRLDELYTNFVERESVHYEQVRSDKNLNRRKLIEILTSNDTVANADVCSERFCYCGKDLKDFMVECQLCLDWFHYNCAIEKDLLKPTDKVDHHQLFICCLCTRGKRPKLKEIDLLLSKLKRLSVRLIEGELFKRFRLRINKWIERLHAELASYPELEMLYNGKSTNTEAISDEIRTILEDLLFQSYALGVDLEEIGPLWKVFVALNSTRKTVMWYGGTPGAKRKGMLCWESKNRKNKKATTQRNEENSAKSDKGFAAHSYDDDADYHYAYEACGMNEGCIKPNGKELHWIACDTCGKWYHQICQGILKPSQKGGAVEAAFFCSFCTALKANPV